MAAMLAAILGKQSCTYYAFVINVMCTKFSAERPTSHFGGHVGGHFWKKNCTCYSFVTKVMCTKFGAERPTSHFSQGRPLEMAAMLAAIFGKQLTKSCTSMQRYCVPNLVTKEPTVYKE